MCLDQLSCYEITRGEEVMGERGRDSKVTCTAAEFAIHLQLRMPDPSPLPAAGLRTVAEDQVLQPRDAMGMTFAECGTVQAHESISTAGHTYSNKCSHDTVEIPDVILSLFPVLCGSLNVEAALAQREGSQRHRGRV